MNAPQSQDDAGFDPLGDGRRAAQIFWLLLSGLAMTLKVYFRYGFGIRQPGLSGFVGVLMMCLSICCIPVDPRPMLAFITLTLVMCFVRQTGARRREARGMGCHSDYDGRSSLADRIDWLPERYIHKYVEPLIAMVLGLFVSLVAPTVGLYLAFAGFCLMLHEAVQYGAATARLRRMRDQYLSQRGIGEDFRAFMRQRGDN